MNFLRRAFETKEGRPDWTAITAFASLSFVIQSGIADQYFGYAVDMKVFDSFYWIVIIMAGLSDKMANLMSKIPIKFKANETPNPDTANTNSSNPNSTNLPK